MTSSQRFSRFLAQAAVHRREDRLAMGVAAHLRPGDRRYAGPLQKHSAGQPRARNAGRVVHAERRRPSLMGTGSDRPESSSRYSSSIGAQRRQSPRAARLRRRPTVFWESSSATRSCGDADASTGPRTSAEVGCSPRPRTAASETRLRAVIAAPSRSPLRPPRRAAQAPRDVRRRKRARGPVHRALGARRIVQPQKSAGDRSRRVRSKVRQPAGRGSGP